MTFSRQPSGSNTNLAVDLQLHSEQAGGDQLHLQSYSHGFEKIYALENIDIRSVRKIDLSASSKSLIDSVEKHLEVEQIHEIDLQLEFNFNALSSATLEPFILREPIQVLGLSKRIESFLNSQGKRLIIDLLNEDRRSLTEIKGLGLGHLDELQGKLQNYLKKHAAGRIDQIDFSSWVRTLIAEIEPKKAFVALENFALSHLVSLTTAESAEIRKLSNEKRQEWEKESLELFRSPEKIQQVHQDIQKIVGQFILPWMEKRLGLATETELMERFVSLGQVENQAVKAIAWLKSVYFNHNLPLERFLRKIDARLYASTPTVEKNVLAVVAKARSYFYKSDNHYTLLMLSKLLAREFAKEWCGFAEGFIEQALRLNSHFRVRKDPLGALVVKLS